MDQLLTQLFSLSTFQLGVGIAITAAIVAVVVDWRLALFSVLAQFVFVGLLLNSELPGGLGMISLITGGIACLLFYWTARRIETVLGITAGEQRWFASNREAYPMGLPFRFLALIFAALVLLPFPDRLAFLPFERSFLVPACWLLGMGLLTIILTRDPLKTGMGLLAFQNGFELLYSRLEPGLAVIGLLNIGTILVALVASYLAVARHLTVAAGPRLVAPLPESLPLRPLDEPLATEEAMPA